MVTAIYTITNKHNGKLYVGISGNIKKRWRAHRNMDGVCSILYSAFKKYGIENFEFKHIADAFSWKNACELEKHLIKEMKTKSPNGYNLTDGGDGTLGFKHSQEECKKRSERCPTRNPEIAKIVADKLRGRKRPDVTGENNAMFGRIGEKSHILKHRILATNLTTGKQIILIGAKQIADAGFNRAHVYSCAKKKRKTHLNHSFTFIRSL